MHLRSPKERLVQSLAFETSGLLVVSPILAVVSGAGLGGSAGLVLAITLAGAFWPPLCGAGLDRMEWRLWQRRASDRPAWLRLAHALALETGDTVISVPILIWLGGLPLTEALLADAGLTAFYLLYDFLFYLAYDRLRPVGGPAHAKGSISPAALSAWNSATNALSRAVAMASRRPAISS